MIILNQKSKQILMVLLMATFATLGVLPSSAMSQTIEITLVGAQEVPPVNTAATGKATITIAADQSVSGSIFVGGMDAKAAHIHTGAPGISGPVIIPFEKTGENVWILKKGAKFTDEQYKNYKAGNLYINVHSPAFPAGEIRGQISPM